MTSDASAGNDASAEASRGSGEERTEARDLSPDQARDNTARLGLCLLAGVAADYFFRGQPIGVSLLLFTLFYYYALLGWTLRRAGLFQPAFSFGWILAAPVLLLALTFALFASPILRTINLFLIPLLLLLQTALLARRTRHSWENVQIASDLADLVKEGVRDVAPSLRTATVTIPPRLRRQLGKVLLGLALSVPFVALILVLLTSADQVFARYFERFSTALSALGPLRILWHGLVICAVALLLSGWLWSIEKREIRERVQSAPPPKRTLDPTVLSTMLVTINLVYALFCVVQFSYLFGHGEGRLPAGFTYAEYARRGFFELTVATLLNMWLALIGLLFARREGGASEKILRGLLGLIVAQSAVILASAFYRLSLYEAAYGYTRARFFAQAMIVLMGLTLVFVFAWVWSERLPFWKLLLIAALADYIALNYANVDSRIARNNIDRYFASGKLDLAYLEGLSADALPAMTRLLEAKDAEIARAARAHLENWRSALAAPTPWHSINASKRRAARLLEEKL